jgi:hypothetical protein
MHIGNLFTFTFLAMHYDTHPSPTNPILQACSSVLRIRDVYPGFRIFSIQDPGSEIFPSRIRIFSIQDPHQRI